MMQGFRLRIGMVPSGFFKINLLNFMLGYVHIL